MIPADLPENEQERLDVLYRYEILDTEAEKVFDDLTSLASDICETNIALISLVDPKRQWFKSKVGLSASETSRDIAFCSHAILQKEIFEVTDTLQDERFRDNPLVTSDPNIRSYAGAPLISPSGLVIGTLCAINDKPKTLNEYQRNALEILSREVISQLELRIKIKQIENSNQIKTDFLSHVSHELRTPLNAIISFSQLMLNDKQHKMPDHYNTYLKHLDYSGKRLLQVVNSVLDLEKIESGVLELDLAMMDVDNFFNSTLGLITPIADKKSLTIELALSTNDIHSILVDEARLSQIVLNILTNAIKFSKPKQTVKLNVFVNAKTLTIAVKDQGIGIAEKDIHLLFSKFRQVGKASTQEGFGLGLMITKSLVDLMDGKINLASSLNNGTLVKVDIPLQSVSKQSVEAYQPTFTMRFSKRARILVVEDNEINRQVASAIFASLGLKIVLSDTGEEAVELLANNDFDLIFMDIHMPGIDGIEATRQIIAKKPNQKIVALTADTFLELEQKLQSCKMVAVISKPIEIKKIVDVLNTYCPVN
ncbi:MAG: ATP-binding protein [Pseudomonadota bacterium]